MASIGQWQNFFESCGIPSESCAKFARTFHSQRIQPDMIGEIDRETFAALGVTMIGDQFAITRYAKKCGGDIPDFASSRRESPPARRVQLAPDRHDIYHVRLPEGKTSKTREILRRNEILKQEGVIKRGTSGVRKGGLACEPVGRSSNILTRVSTTSTVITKRKPGVVSAPSVVLTSQRNVEQRGNVTIPRYGTLVSDSMPSKSKSIMVSDVSSSSGGSRLSRTNGPTFVVTFGGNKNQGISSRLGGGAHRPQQQQRVTRVVNERIPITSRLGVRGGGGSRRPVFVYEDDDDLEEIVYEEAQPSVFDRVSAVRRF